MANDSNVINDNSMVTVSSDSVSDLESGGEHQPLLESHEDIKKMLVFHHHHHHHHLVFQLFIIIVAEPVD